MSLHAFRATDVPTRTVDDFREALRGHEVKLSAAKKQRDVIQIDMRKATLAVDLGDQKARLELHNLRKSDDATARLIASLEVQIIEARKRLAMAETQAATAEAKRAIADEAAVPHDKLFAVVCPDGRKVRHRHESLEALQKALQPGYVAVGQVFGANEDDTGGIVSRSGAQSVMKAMLAAHGEELLAWLTSHGIKSTEA